MKTSFLNIKPGPSGGQKGRSSRCSSRRRAAAIPTVEGQADEDLEPSLSSSSATKRCEIKYETTTTSDKDNDDEAYGTADSANLLYIKSIQEVEEPKISARLQAFIEPIWEQTRIIVPHIGIMCLSLLYIISGAATFYAIESPFELASLHQNCLSIQNLTTDDLNSLWYAIGRTFIPPREVYSSMGDPAYIIFDRMSRHLLDIFDRDHYIILERLHGQTMQEIRCQNIPNEVVKEWTSSTTLFFATTMLTTIGYGNLVPATPLGRVVCCIYGILGIPLLLVTTANCGSFISDCLRMLHKKLHPRIDNSPVLPRMIEPDEANTLIDQPPEAPESVSESDDEQEEPVPASWVLAIILLYVFLGTFLLPLFEPWSYFESFYFCLITITTIGYGDYVPLNRNYYFLTLSYILLGLALVTMSMELVAGQYIKKVHFFGRKIVLAKEALRNAKQLMKCMSLFGGGGARQLPGEPVGFRTTRFLSLAPELYIFHRLLVRSGAYTPADIDRILFIDHGVWDPYKNVTAPEEDCHSSMIYMDDLAGLVITEDLHEMKSEMDFPLMEQRIILSRAKRRAKSWDNGKMWFDMVCPDCRRNTL